MELDSSSVFPVRCVSQELGLSRQQRLQLAAHTACQSDCLLISLFFSEEDVCLKLQSFRVSSVDL